MAELEGSKSAMSLQSAPCATISLRRLGYAGLPLALSLLLILLGKGTIPYVVALHGEVIPDHPYFLPGEAALLYVILPLIVMSALVLFMAPGMLVVLAMGRCTRFTEQIIWAFAVSLGVYFLISSAIVIIPPPVAGPQILLLTYGSAGCIAWAVLALRVSRGHGLAWPFAQPSDVRRLFWVIAIPTVTLLTLLPLFLWQDMHDDGFEALELGRSLSANLLPRFPTPAAVSPIGAGLLPMAYPVHWFVTLFGPVEAAARFPLLLYLPVLYCLVVELIEWDSRRSLGISEEAVLFLGLAVFTVVMAYNASYDPYFADIAAPTAFETLTLISILATVYFLWRGHDTWFFFFALLSYLCRPTGLMVLGLLGIAVPISAPSRCKALLRRVLAAIFIVLLFTQVYNNVYLPLIAGKLNLGIPFGGILKRYQYLRLDDWSRLNYILYPSGILPAFSLLAFRWQDALGRLIILVTVMYFLLFVVPAFVALHHFVPVMVLPLVAFWRLYLQRTERMPGLTLLAVAALGILSLWLSLPRHFELNRTLRSIGQRTELRIGDYETEYRSLVSRFRLLFRLIPPDWEVEDPNVELVSGYASLIYYATRQKSAGVQINYIVQPLEDPAPPGFTQAATDDVAALYVRDKQQWLRDRYQSLRTDFRSTLYDIPRSVLFRHWGVPRGEYTIDLLQLLPAGIAELILQHQGQ